MNIGVLTSRPTNSSSSLSPSLLDEGTEKQSRLAKFFRKSVFARRVLLFIAMLGTCMVIGDGILTPAISGISLCVLFFFYFGKAFLKNFF